MKNYIIAASYVDWTDEWEVEKLNHSYNAVILSGGSSNASKPIDIEKNFLQLCGLMEDNGSSFPQDYSVLQFYGKLNYISEKIERENKANSAV